jgi:hypothetical protein
MARFIDRHPTNPNLPPEVLTIIRQRLQSDAPDEFGDQGINVFIGVNETYCYTEAPDAEAVRKAHEAIGVFLEPDDIAEVLVLP